MITEIKWSAKNGAKMLIKKDVKVDAPHARSAALYVS